MQMEKQLRIALAALDKINTLSDYGIKNCASLECCDVIRDVARNTLKKLRAG